jgi:hypothetical protein
MSDTKIAKNIILVGGDKGGVGKSATSRILTEYLDEHSRPHLAFDGDDVNPTFLRFYPNATRIFTKSVKGFEVLINNLEGATPYQLVDLGAGTSLMFAQFAHKTGFLEEVAAVGGAVTFVFVLAPSVDSIHLLKLLYEQYRNSISYVIAKSEAVPGSWDLWTSTKTREALLKAGAIEITIPALDVDAFALADRHSLSWDAASEDKRLPLASRSYLKRWRKLVFEQFDQAQSLLLRS